MSVAPALLAAGLFFGAASAAEAAAQMQRYRCDLHGETAEMVALVEEIDGQGLTWRDEPGTRPAAVVSNTVITHLFTGELRSDAVHYIFTGRNKFADFTDLVEGRRFRAQLNVLPDGALIIVLDPFGPGPIRAHCVIRD